MSDRAIIVDQGFEPYTGQRTSLSSRPLVITAGQLKLAWKETWLRRLLWLAAMPLVVLAVLQVIKARFGGLGGVFPLWEIYWGLQSFFALLVSYFVGRRAVGEDLHSGAMIIYLSRPISLFGYSFGKWLAAALAVAVITIAPGWLLAWLRYVTESSASLGRLVRELGALLAGGMMLAFTFSLVMLAISSLTRRARASGILWLGVVFGSAMAAEGLARTWDFVELRALGVLEGNVRFTLWLLGQEQNGWMAFAGLGGQIAWALLSLMVLRLRLHAVVRES
jgi:hypothetical protein